jgi:putative transposase
MPNYRRAFIPGGCWFFTVNLLERRRTLLVDHVDALRDAFEETRRTYPFKIAAIVVLPDHLHAVWTLPPADSDFSTRWRLVKTRFAKALPKLERRSAVRKQRNERGIWQRRYWARYIALGGDAGLLRAAAAVALLPGRALPAHARLRRRPEALQRAPPAE